MKAVLFLAGMGDVIRTIYQTDRYRYISEATSPVPIILASHNPFTSEIFRYHRNARNFVIYELAHKYDEFLASGLRGEEIDQALCAFAGLEYDPSLSPPLEGYDPPFYAPDGMDSSGHIVLQPFAGNDFFRTLPPPLMERMLPILRAQSCPVYLITRSYFRQGATGRQIHGIEDGRRYAGGNIHLLENLSVPASLNLMKQARCYVGSWSSLQQTAWFANKPVAVWYPSTHVDVVERTPYAFGLDRDDCLHAPYSRFSEEEFGAWLERWQPSASAV